MTPRGHVRVIDFIYSLYMNDKNNKILDIYLTFIRIGQICINIFLFRKLLKIII